MSGAMLAVLVVVALVLSMAVREGWPRRKRYPPRDNELPLSLRRPIDILIVLVALVALLGGVLWLAGWELAEG